MRGLGGTGSPARTEYQSRDDASGTGSQRERERAQYLPPTIKARLAVAHVVLTAVDPVLTSPDDFQ